MRGELTIWQEMVSPHISPLASALATRFARVRIVTLSGLDPRRAAIGWRDGEDAAFEQIHAPSEAERLEALIGRSGPHDLHLLPGLKPAPWLRPIQRQLTDASAAIAILSEGPRRDSGWPKRIAVGLRDRRLARQWRTRVKCIFATGDEAVAHYISAGFPREKVHAFGYFPKLGGESAASGEGSGAIPLIGVAAKLERYKGVDLLLRALARLQHRDWRLRVTGDGAQRPKLERLARDLGMEDRIDWLGWRRFDTMPDFLASSDLVVVPSRYDGWGAVVNEALGVGTPVVASDSAGAHCVLVHRELGSTFTSRDVSAMAEAIARQLDRPMTAQQRTAIRDWANKALSPDAAAEFFCAVLDNGGAVQPPWLVTSFGESH